MHLTCPSQKSTSIDRAKQCSKEVACSHLEKLKHCLCEHGIYDSEKNKFVEGKEGNLIWLDEMGQFFNYLLRRGRRQACTGVRGKAAKTADKENRGQFSVDAAIGFDMFLYDPHLIFAQDSLSADMAPTCVKDFKHMLLSNTAKGCQTGMTFLSRMKALEKQARKRGVKGTIVYATDGHGSRFWTQATS